MLASASLLFAFVVSTWPAAARCQDVASPTGATEIWMSGKDVTITRQLHSDRGQTEGCDDDEFARAMITIAQQRNAAGDDKTAAWLSQWAHQLTSGRIAAEEFSESHPPRIKLEFAEAIQATDDATTRPTAQPAETAALAAELPQSAPQEQRSTAELTLEPSGWPADAIASQSDAGSETLVETCSAAAVVSVESSSHDASRELRQAIKQTKPLSSAAQPLVGAVGTHALLHTAQAELTLGPIAIALFSFASGAAFCAALCVVLALVLVRARVERQAPPPGSSDISPNVAKTETRPATLSTTDARDKHRERNKQDKNGSIMESFYNQNVELYKQLAHSG